MSTSDRQADPPPAGGAFDLDVSSWPELPRVGGVFVTGTDTEVGKTVVAGAIARYLRRAGHDVEVFKPAASGCRHARGTLVSADADCVLPGLPAK